MSDERAVPELATARGAEAGPEDDEVVVPGVPPATAAAAFDDSGVAGPYAPSAFRCGIPSSPSGHML